MKVFEVVAIVVISIVALYIILNNVNSIINLQKYLGFQNSVF